MAGLRKYKSLYSSTANTFGTGEGVTITPGSVSGLPTDTEITLTFDRVTSGGVATPSLMERIKGSISGSNFVVSSGGRGFDGSTEQAHTSPVVEMIWNAVDWNDAMDAMINVVSKTTGAVDTTKVVTPTGTQTLTNKTLTTPIISAISNTGTVTLPTATDTLIGRATTDTLTNKRITNRIQSVADAATVTPDADANDMVDITAIAQAFTIANPTGTPTNGQKLLIRWKDNGTARAITWGNGYVAGGAALPSTTTLSKIGYAGFIYNTANTLNKWQCVTAPVEA